MCCFKQLDAFELWCWGRPLRVLWTVRIKPINPKGNQPWIFIGRTDEAETPTLRPSDVKSQLIGKDPDAGKDWRQEEEEMIEDEMAGWHYWLNAHEFEQTLGDGEGQGSLVCCSSRGHRVGHDWATEQQESSSWVCVWLFGTPWTLACQAPLPMGFSRQEYWSGLPYPSPV